MKCPWTPPVDPQVAALLTLVQGAVNADLTAALGQDAIDGVHGHPLPLSILSNTKMPALAIWRQVERWEQTTIHHVEHPLALEIHRSGSDPGHGSQSVGMVARPRASELQRCGHDRDRARRRWG